MDSDEKAAYILKEMFLCIKILLLSLVHHYLVHRDLIISVFNKNAVAKQ
jgi:hypothetical protein